MKPAKTTAAPEAPEAQPQAGGSYTRAADGALVPNTPDTPAVEPAPEVAPEPPTEE